MLPLDSLLHRLESAGFRISPADRLRVVQLLEAMGNECLENPQKLRLLLAPILARSAAEQAKFYEVFDSWMPKPIAGLTPSHPDNKRLRWLLAAGLVVAILLVAGYFKYCESSTNNQVIQGPVQSGVVDTLKTKPAQNEGKTPLKEEKEILKPELPVKNLLLAKEKELPRPAWPAWSLLGFLILASAWMWWKWARRSKPLPSEAKPLQGPAGIIQGEIADAPPYTIPFRGQEAYIRTGREQYRLADAMRQRQQGEHPYMDVPASVQATLDKGGFPTLRFRMRRQPADYLCIMEEKHRQSHLARLFKFFTEHIRGQDVALEIFQASGTLDRFWNAQHPGGLTLEQLQRLYPAHRLIVFGDAHALLDISASGAARVRPEMGAAFRRWRQRVLFTPNAPITWTFEEKALYDLFVLFPATLQGMNDAAHHIEASVGVAADDEAPPSFARWREQAQQRGQSVQGGEDHRYTRWRDASDHEEYLAGRPDLLLWLRALAVYPVPTWEITLAIGQSLEKQGVTVRPDDLLILSRIGWLQNGRMPAGLREEFMEDLPPEAETAARQAVIAALEEARAEAGNGFAGIELGVNVAIQEFALAPHDPEKQEVLRLLFEAGRVNKAQEQVADLALAKTLEVSKTSKGAQPLSAREFVKKAVEETPEAEPPKRPFFTRHFWIAIGLTLCAVGFGLLMYMLWFFLSWIPEEEKNRDWAQRNLFDWQVQTDSATIWNNRGVQVWNERRDTAEAMRLFNKAFLADSTGVIDLSILDTSIPFSANILASVNHQILRYNLAAEALNSLFEKVPLPPSDLRFYRKTPEDNPSFDVFGPDFDVNILSNCGLRLVGTERNPLWVDLEKTKVLSIQKDAIHAKGLILLYYLSREGAEKSYIHLKSIDSNYFANLRSQRPNLETLLSNLQNTQSLSNLIDSKQGFKNSIVKPQIFKDSNGSPNLPETGSVQDLPKSSITLASYLPINLYFENDYPKIDSPNQDSVLIHYQQTFVHYIRQKEVYKMNFSKNLSGIKMQAAIDSVENFFEKEVRYNWDNFYNFSDELITLLENGDTIILIIKGYASPLSTASYNFHLTNRRITSVYNHFMLFDAGVFQPYRINGQLVIIREPNGDVESVKEGGGSNPKDLRNSIFSLQAARSRRVQIIGAYVKK